MLPTISVVIPSYNGEAWIADTLASVFSQTHLPDEVIVVDDASTDETVERVMRLANDAPVPVHLIQQPTNSGCPATSINAGIAHASGELIAVLDQDDVFLPPKLERQAGLLAADPGLAFVFSLYRRHNRFGTLWDLPAGRFRIRHFQRRMKSSKGCLRCDGAAALEAITRSATNFFGGFPGFMFRRSAWEKKAGLDESFVVGADFEFVCWLCTQGAVGLIPEFQYRRHEHGNNISRSSGIRGHLDVVRALLRYADLNTAAELSRAFRRSIAGHLWDIARRLASGGYRHASQTVAKAASEMTGADGYRRTQRLAIRAYVVYYRLIRRPWQISAAQAEEALAVARTASQQFA